MNNLILSPNGANSFPVNCRDVHLKLDSKTKYPTWIKQKLSKYGFSEGIDFISSLKSNAKGRGRRIHEYNCTYDMAKELCLVENTHKGREIRLYFIELEKQVKSGGYVPTVELSPAEQLLAYAQRMVDQEKQIKSVVVEVKRVEQIAKQENDTLTHDQISELDALINAKWKETGDVKDVGRMRKKIKQRFFELMGGRTYKEIPRHGFEEAKRIVKNYGLMNP